VGARFLTALIGLGAQVLEGGYCSLPNFGKLRGGTSSMFNKVKVDRLREELASNRALANNLIQSNALLDARRLEMERQLAIELRKDRTDGS
jgi:hypothetical protein